MVQVTVGQIGLGNMGGNIARHLIDEGFDVVGYDISDEALAELEAYGGTVAESNADLAANVDVLLSGLKDPAIVEQAYLGNDGVIAGAHEDLVCIEQSTVPPESTRELGDALRDHDVDLLDCPFLGGPPDCRNGTLILPVGGDRELYDDERVRAVLDAQSRETHYMGDVGDGKATKLVNNCISLGNTALALEAMALGAAQGLEPDRLFDALKFGAGSSVAFRLFVPTALNRDFEPAFPVAYTQKDLRYALRASEEVDYPMNITSTILQQYTAAAAEGYKRENSPAVVKVFEEYLDGTLEASERIEPPADDPILSR